MTARQAAVLVLSGVIVLLAALPVGFVGGPVQWLAAAVAAGLCVPTAVGTFWLSRWLAARHPLGGVIGMLVGTIGRLVVALGGGAAVFFLSGAFADAKVGFWLWLLFAYLATLLAETALLVRPSPAVSGGPQGEKG